MTQFEKYLNDLQRFGIRPGLERVRALLELLGNPQNDYPIILIGGTNGKGSSCEFLARTLARENRVVGLFTSPHLYAWNERLRVLDVENASQKGFAGQIADDELDTLFAAARAQIQAVAASQHGQPTEFEVLTALGFLHFARAKVDIAVIEVGLGGKWDATNVCNPLVSVVTHVALDHCDRLGDTHVEIARDKVCIARAGRVLVTAETRDDVLSVFRAHCDQIGAKLWSFRDIEYSNDAENLHNALRISPPSAPAAIELQRLNLQTAQLARVALSQTALAKTAWAQVDSSKVDAQLDRFNDLSIYTDEVPGRFQIVRDKPMLILDGANNPDGAQLLTAQLQRVLESRPQARLTLVLGILRDKDYRAMVAVLAPLAHRVIATQSASPRACEAEIIAIEARKFCAEVETASSVAIAVERALAASHEKDVICLTGSFYTIAGYEY